MLLSRGQDVNGSLISRNATLRLDHREVFLDMKNPWMVLLLFVVFLGACSSTESPQEPKTKNTMQGLGYLSGYEEPLEQTGVTVHEDTAYDGLNLWVSGHKPGAYLMDMDGSVVHEWEKSWEEAFPEVELRPAAKKMLMTTRWRKVPPTRQGELFAIFEHSGFLKLDRDSRLLWSHFHNQHHDLDVDESGTIYTLAKSYEEVELFGGNKKRLNGLSALTIRRVICWKNTTSWKRSDDPRSVRCWET